MAKRRKQKKQKPAKSRKGWFRRILIGAAAAAVWAVVAMIGVLAFYAYDLPDVDKALSATRRPTVTLRTADGGHLATIGDLHGLPVTLNDLPPVLPQAVLATEDRRFYRHFGLDPVGLARAAYRNITAGRIVQGGSTLTQQVAKNLFLTPERTIKRKIQELLLALWLESKFSKDQILTIYLNRVYLGAGTYGVEAAARRYFNRSARQVNTYQAAMLAGLLKAPSRYNPVSSPERAKRRTHQVLANMVAAGVLEQRDADAVKKGAAAVRAKPTTRVSRYFTDWVLSQVPSYVTPGDADIIVTTTLDGTLQKDAENAVARALATGKKHRVGQAALVALAPDGAVRAMVGGADYGLSQFNRATQARRQPGSAFKPIVYLAGVEGGLRPDSPMVDEPLSVDGWSPRNFTRRHRGGISLRDALAQSVNTVAVKVSERAGRDRVIAAARRLGVTADLQASPSLALGVNGVSLLEMTAAYGPFANGGYGVWPFGISEIRDARGRVLYSRRGSGPGRVVEPGAVAAMNDMLSHAVGEGTGRAARIGRPVAGKTGTSQNFRDAWFIGYSADLIAGVWMGNDDQAAMDKVTGGGLPAKTWKGFMAAAHGGTPPRPLPGTGATAPPPSGREDGGGDGFWGSLMRVLRGE